MADLEQIKQIAAAGMDVQTARLKVVAENMANANTTAISPGGDPYRRQTISFKNALDRASGTNLVQVNKISTDQGDLPTKYDPSHPAADAQGLVKEPNVNMLVEAMDMREAQKDYEANLSEEQIASQMETKTINLLSGK
jgi:flagellar basal-body rod protein FlgC